ncbi:MAG: hypothetical protein R3F24_04715 [Gammaproteobacteria bacterium]
MNQSREVLRRRREHLVARSSAQRRNILMHAQQIEQQFAPIDRGFARIRQVVTPGRLLGTAITLTLILGRGRMRGLLVSGLAVAGVVRRWRSSTRLVASLLVPDQDVSRSR